MIPTIPDEARAYALGVADGKRAARNPSGMPVKLDISTPYALGYLDGFSRDLELQTRLRENRAPMGTLRPGTDDRWKHQ